MRTKLNCRTRQECTRGYNIDQMCQKNYQKKKKEKRCKIARGAQTALLGQISINKFSFIPLALCATIDRKCRNSGCVARSLNLGHSRARSRSRGNFRFQRARKVKPAEITEASAVVNASLCLSRKVEGSAGGIDAETAGRWTVKFPGAAKRFAGPV